MTSIQTGWSIYRIQMSQLGFGDALWEPAPNHGQNRIELGDVGYVRRGHFHLLFSAGRPLGDRRLGVDVPQAFVPLTIGPITHSQPRPPGHLSTTCIVREGGASPGSSANGEPVLEPGYNVLFDITNGQGAALITKHRTYREDVELESAFKAYTKRHYDSWVRFARDKGHGDAIKPVLVTGVDLTRNFAMMAYLSDDERIRSEFRASALADPVSDWGTWHTVGPVHKNCGPLLLSPSATRVTKLKASRKAITPKGYDQCVFVRYFTIRKRASLFPRVVRAAAGPHDLGPGDRKDKGLPQVGTGSDSDPSSSESDLIQRDENASSYRDSIADGSSAIHETSFVRPSVPHPQHEERDKQDQGGDPLGCDGGSYFEEHDAAMNEEDEEASELDKIAEYIFQNSDAESALLHHRDIVQARESGDHRGKDILLILAEKRPDVSIDLDEDGSKFYHLWVARELTSTFQPVGTIAWRNGSVSPEDVSSSVQPSHWQMGLDSYLSLVTDVNRSQLYGQGDIEIHGVHPIAGGPFADIWAAALHGQRVIIKSYRVYSVGGPQSLAPAQMRFLKEVTVCSRLIDHKNIVSFRAMYTTQMCPLALVYDFVEHGCLREYLRGGGDAGRVRLLTDVARGLLYLHESGVIHGGINTDNILVGADGVARIGGLGSASIPSHTSHLWSEMDTKCMSHGTAPELLRSGPTGSRNETTKESDMYAFALLAWELFEGGAPFPEMDRLAAVNALAAGRRLPRPQNPELSDAIWDIIKRCWDKDPSRRLSAREVVEILTRESSRNISV